MDVKSIDSMHFYAAHNCKKTIDMFKTQGSGVPSIADFFIDRKPKPISSRIERGLNKFVEEYSRIVERNEAEAVEASKHIYLIF